MILESPTQIVANILHQTKLGHSATAELVGTST